MATRATVLPLTTPFFSQNALSTDFQKDDLADFRTYFSLVQQERNPHVAKHHAIESFQDILDIVNYMQTHPQASFADIRSHLQSTKLGCPPSQISFSIELAVRPWLMINARNTMPSDRVQLESSIPWPDGLSLEQIIDQQFSSTRPPNGNISSRFSKHLNVTDMGNIAGFRVEWTNNLNFHLISRGSVIYIFHNVSALRRLSQSLTDASPNNTSLFFPPGFFEETLASIDLLMPLKNSNCNGWLAREIQNWGLDRNIIHRDPPNLNKDYYRYWQDRLLEIEEAFQRTNSRSIFQWWHDRRDMQLWWGFWLVMVGIFLTVLFGLIQSVTGVIQVVMAARGG